MEQYFEFRWSEDRNQALCSGEDLLKYEQLTQETKQDLYRKFLFTGFLKSYSRSFSIPNWDSPNPYSFYTWNDPVYASFMMNIMRALEPR